MSKREGEIRIPSACAIAGLFAKDGSCVSGEKIVRAMTTMHERSNGLGGGFAGYKCTLQTDTEVITYMIDYLMRKKGLTLSETADIIAAPFWSEIEKKAPAERDRLTYLRNTFASMLVTGPFSILLGFDGGMMALNDRLKLRSMVVGEKGETVYAASEECALRMMEPDIENIRYPAGGEPVIVTLNGSENQWQ